MRNGASWKSHTGLFWKVIAQWGYGVGCNSQEVLSGHLYPIAVRTPARVLMLTSLTATCFSSSSMNPWRNKTMPFGRRSRPCSLSWQGGAGHCICMNACAELTVVPALLCCPLDPQSRPNNSQDNLPLMDTMATRNNWACSRLLAPLPELSSSLQVHALMNLLASSLSPCPHWPLTLSR